MYLALSISTVFGFGCDRADGADPSDRYPKGLSPAAHTRIEGDNPSSIDIEGDRSVVENRDFTARFDAARTFLLERESGLRGHRR